MATAAPNVWQQMNYVPPRGQCNFKASLMSPKCPCLRFMLHPLKSASSFECDGCSHHASFHSMENKAEDEIRKRWETEAKSQEGHDEQALVPRPRKRRRELEDQNNTEAGTPATSIFGRLIGTISQEITPSQNQPQTAPSSRVPSKPKTSKEKQVRNRKSTRAATIAASSTREPFDDDLYVLEDEDVD